MLSPGSRGRSESRPALHGAHRLNQFATSSSRGGDEYALDTPPAHARNASCHPIPGDRRRSGEHPAAEARDGVSISIPLSPRTAQLVGWGPRPIPTERLGAE